MRVLVLYVVGVTSIYHCPSDQSLERPAKCRRLESAHSQLFDERHGRKPRHNPRMAATLNNPGYRQFFKLEQMPQPTEIFVFLDEHPDTINDGFYLPNIDGHGLGCEQRRHQ